MTDADPPITRADKLRELRREIQARRTIHARQVTANPMTQRATERGVAILEAIAADYEGEAKQ